MTSTSCVLGNDPLSPLASQYPDFFTAPKPFATAILWPPPLWAAPHHPDSGSMRAERGERGPRDFNLSGGVGGGYLGDGLEGAPGE